MNKVHVRLYFYDALYLCPNNSFGVDEDKENIDSSQDRSIVHEQGEEGPSDSTLIHESGKMLFLITLLDNLKAEGHRCLVFSQSRKMLDIIQRVIKHRVGWVINRSVMGNDRSDGQWWVMMGVMGSDR